MPHARYRGRHRTPNNTARLTAVGAIGVGTMAASVIAPTAANAATNAQWDRVAHCESTDQWHDNTGNGYYGGLQFSYSTWSSYDNHHYASRADLASRTQQIEVANRVLDSQGWGAWPVCSQYRGEPGPTHTHHSHSAAAHTHHSHSTKAHKGHGKTHEYTVKSGDTLSEIATKHHVKGGWQALYHHNRHVIGANPSLIRVGMKLKV
jgi:nucleoid-associated protein YgaU